MPLPAALHALASANIVDSKAFFLIAICAGAWLLNQGIRAFRLRRSTEFESRAAWSLLAGSALRPFGAACVFLLACALAAAADSANLPALLCGCAAVLLSRHLFFVTVVPLNMALTFVRSRPAGPHA